MKNISLFSLAITLAGFMCSVSVWAAGPSAAPTAPTYPATQVKAVYSDIYSSNCNFGAWQSGTVYTQETYGKKFVTGNSGYFGLEKAQPGSGLNCAHMEKLHLDVFCDEEGKSIGIVPIWGGEDSQVKKNLIAGQWTSIDIALSEFSKITNWTDIYQIKFNDCKNMTFWLNNIYFYRTTPLPEDTEAPTDFTATHKAKSYFSVELNVKAKDNSGSVIYKVYAGEKEMAKLTAVSDVAEVITIKDLKPDSAYEFVVKAMDEAGNVNASPITIKDTTLALPAPATKPMIDADKVASFYSDAYKAAGKWIQGYWQQTTTTSRVALVEGDTAILCTKSNYLGWELQKPIPKLDTLNRFHMDIYVEADDSITFSPIWQKAGVTTDTLQRFALKAGWNTIDTLLSFWPNIDLTTIFQLKWASMPTECFIDNVFFYYDSLSAPAPTPKPITLPKPAPAPTSEAENVMAIYSDAYTPVTKWSVGYWQQTTKTSFVALAEGDTALFCTESNYLGWEFAKTDLDFSEMERFHMVVYVENAGSIKFSPIWHSGTEVTELLKNFTLVAGWNALDAPLTDWTGINLKDIFQLKWANMPNECYIDNVYFYKKPASSLYETPSPLGEGRGEAVKFVQNGRLIIMHNGRAVSILGQDL